MGEAAKPICGECDPISRRESDRALQGNGSYFSFQESLMEHDPTARVCK